MDIKTNFVTCNKISNLLSTIVKGMPYFTHSRADPYGKQELFLNLYRKQSNNHDAQ